MNKIQLYRTFLKEFGEISLFRGANVEGVGIDYVKAIKSLASIQHKPSTEIPLLSL